MVESKYILKDKGYDAKSNRDTAKAMWSLLIGAENLREVSRFWYSTS